MISMNPGAAPTVVFISQLGKAGYTWQSVIDLLTTGAATITYDRPAIGDCPPRPAPNPPLPYSVFAGELEALLEERQVSGPLVVVGHSVGSLIARMFVDRNPGRVAGIVHIDGSIPRLSLWPAAVTDQSPDGDGPDATGFDLVAGEVEILEAFVPRVPAAVVTRTPGRWSGSFVPERCDPLWSAYQRRLAHEHRTPLIVAADAGHQIPAEAPQLVAFVIDHVVREVRGRTARIPDEASLAFAGGRFTVPVEKTLGMLVTPEGKARARKMLDSAGRDPERFTAMRERIRFPAERNQ